MLTNILMNFNRKKQYPKDIPLQTIAENFSGSGPEGGSSMRQMAFNNSFELRKDFRVYFRKFLQDSQRKSP